MGQQGGAKPLIGITALPLGASFAEDRTAALQPDLGFQTVLIAHHKNLSIQVDQP
tara:strand:- start:24835 stop:24999 length:165 start_codon:yes stop_codon:yes gene_type:complete